MPKKKEKNELEYLRAENRKLRSINRHLKKKLKQLTKKEHLFDDMTPEPEMRKEKPLKKPKCPKCHQYTIETLDLGKKMVIHCPRCLYRKTKIQ